MLGANADLTGRDNALLGCILNGLTKRRALTLLDEIKAFSGLGEFFEQPVRTYSSGIRSRLGFATAIQTDVDILMLDELLSVGDKDFKQLAEKTMLEKIKSNKSVIFLSHNEARVSKICDRFFLWMMVKHEGCKRNKSRNIGYFPIPKVACTSIKAALFFVEHNRPHDPVRDDGSHVHQYYDRKRSEIGDCDFRFIVIRDPIRRFLSAYNNRVGHHKELTYESVKERSPGALKNIEVFQPNIAQFIDDFEMYYSVEPIRHHTRPISESLSDGLASFTHVYRIEEIGKLRSELESRLGRDIGIPRLQTGGTDVDLKDLSRKQIEFLMDFYQEDYRLLNGYYDVDSVWREWRGENIDEQESAPFIIWTFRRTGGTNLSVALFDASDFDGYEHEPFNKNRRLHWIVDRWNKHKDKASLYRDLDKILSEKKLMKLCLEIMPVELNVAIAELSIKHGYRHLFLYREEAVGRLLSLNYSMKTDIWSKDQARERVVDDKVFREKIPTNKLIHHEINAQHEMQRVYELLLDSGKSPSSISFEQLYNSPFSEASDRVKHLFQELIGKESVCDHDFLDKLLNKGGQKTNSEYVRFSNSEAFIEEVKKLPRFLLTGERKRVGEQNLNPVVSVIIPVYNVSEYINRCLIR